jgi:hypothetical protein
MRFGISFHGSCAEAPAANLRARFAALQVTWLGCVNISSALIFLN